MRARTAKRAQAKRLKKEAKRRVKYYNQVADKSKMDLDMRTSFISQCIQKRVEVGAFEREEEIKRKKAHKKT